MATEYKFKTGEHPLWQIGTKILKKIMRKHHETVGSVLQTLIDKIIASGLNISQYTGKYACNNFLHIPINIHILITMFIFYTDKYLFTDCLTYMCHKLPILVLERNDSIMTLLDQISSIPGEVAIFIIPAIFPLIHASADIREYLILTLRKTLYRKGTCNRQMAVSGILEMLKNLKKHSLTSLAMSSSQYPTSSSTGASSTSVFTQVLIV